MKTEKIHPIQATLIINPSVNHCFTSVSSDTSISYPRPRYKLPHKPTELRAQFHWLAPTIFTPETTNQGISRCIAQKIHGHVLRLPFYAFSIHAATPRNETPVHNYNHMYTESRTFLKKRRYSPDIRVCRVIFRAFRRLLHVWNYPALHPDAEGI
jgi:hypothetical protein